MTLFCNLVEEKLWSPKGFGCKAMKLGNGPTNYSRLRKNWNLFRSLSAYLLCPKWIQSFVFLFGTTSVFCHICVDCTIFWIFFQIFRASGTQFRENTREISKLLYFGKKWKNCVISGNLFQFKNTFSSFITHVFVCLHLLDFWSPNFEELGVSVTWRLLHYSQLKPAESHNRVTFR